jgi:MFS family permease
MQSSAPPAVLATKRPINPWVVFALICVPILIGSIDLTSIVVILPQATLDLLGPKGLSRAGAALWAVTAYLLAYTLGLALVGRLSDVLPRKQIFIACIVIFIIGALWAGFATDLPLTILSALPIWADRESLPLVSLVIARIIQGIGAGASVSVGMALVSDVFPPDKRAEPISLIGALDSLGWVIGNLFAGIMLQILPSWRWLFLINAGLAFVALIGTIFALRGVKQAPSSGKYDIRGAVLFAASLIALTIGIELLQDPGTTAYLLIGGSILLFVTFIFLQLRTKAHALFDMKFIRQPEVGAALITNLLIGFALILVVAGVPLIINLRSLFLRGEGLLTGALRAGIMLCASTIPLVIAVLVGESRYRRVGAAIPVSIGLFVATLGFLGSQFWTYTAPNYEIALPLALIGVGLGLTIGPLSLVVVDAAEESARGLASSLVLTMRLLGMTFGTPPAAAVTLNLANQWADAQVAPMSDTFRNIARPMLIPPLATHALTIVMLLGAAACILGLVLIYLPRTIRTIRVNRLGWRAVLAGVPTMIAGVALVALLSFIDSRLTPTVVSNPIAQQLPPNVELYAGFNMQQMFLKDTQRPLDSAETLIRTAFTPTEPTSADNGSQPSNPPAQDTPPTTPDSATDSLVKLLFRPREWSDKNYQPFCPYYVPDAESEWCFNNGLLSWIGPQAAFALLPRTRADFDYVFVFQATNRNNAIQFATNLAISLGETEPADAGPNVRILAINQGLPEERRLAITDTWVIIGTPKAVEYTLNHGNLSLADQPEYKRIVGQLPEETFATFYIRSANFDTDLKPALLSLVQNSMVDSVSRLLNRASSIFVTRTSTAPTLLGLALRVDENKVGLSVVADFPFSLQKLNALPVRAELLDKIPAVRAWATAHLNISGLARELNIPDTLQTIARETGSTALQSLLDNSLTEGIITSFGQSLQTLLTHAGGEALLITLPEIDGKLTGMGLVLPLVDKDNFKAADALKQIKDRLQLAALTGFVTITEAPTTDGLSSIITINGDGMQSVSPTGVQYLLTSDNVLIVSVGGQIETLAAQIKATSPAARQQIETSWPEQADRQDKFAYGYFFPQMDKHPAAVLFGGAIRRQALYLDVLIEPK